MPLFEQLVKSLTENRGPVSREKLGRSIPPKLYHVTLAAPAILSGGFKTSDQLGGSMVLGGSNGEALSTTDSRIRADEYAHGLQLAVLAADGKIAVDDDLLDTCQSFGVSFSQARELIQDIQKDKARNRWDDKKASHEFFQRLSFAGRKFPLFMGSSWPRTVAAANGDYDKVKTLELGTAGPQIWGYVPSEDEFRIFDPENIDRSTIRVVG